MKKLFINSSIIFCSLVMGHNANAQKVFEIANFRAEPVFVTLEWDQDCSGAPSQSGPYMVCPFQAPTQIPVASGLMLTQFRVTCVPGNFCTPPRAARIHTAQPWVPVVLCPSMAPVAQNEDTHLCGTTTIDGYVFVDFNPTIGAGQCGSLRFYP